MVVRAVGGFAYGVMGADIHVFGDGTPVYLLFEHHRLRNTDPRWLRAQPSRMLDARAEVVEFTGREAELARLVAWRDAAPPFAVRWLHGEGGQGKTRLAARLAEHSKGAGWKVVDAVHGTDTHPPVRDSQDLRLDGTKGVLLLIDYADRWPQTDLSWLFQNTLLYRGVPARVLLIARSVNAWSGVRDVLAKSGRTPDISDQLLPPLPGDGTARSQMFMAARDCFSRLYPQVADPAAIERPVPLAHEAFELTLAVHMAALVAVDAAAHGRKSPADMLGLTVYLLDREHENWRQLYENTERGLHYGTSDRMMARTVFTSILTGSVAISTAASVLDTLIPGAAAGRVLADHAVCYPADSLAMALAPMLPDRLAEDFLALMIPGHTITSFEPDDWAATAPETLLTSSLASSSRGRAVTFLASAADRWPHVGTRVLYPLLRERPGIAVDAGSAALARVAIIGTGERINPGLLSVLEAVDPLLPAGHHADLDVGALAVAERLIGHQLAAEEDQATRAQLLSALSGRRSNAGQWETALAASEQATRLYQELAEADPWYRQHLVSALVQLGGDLTDLGRVSEAFTQTRAAIAIRRELAEADQRHRSALAGELTNLSVGLSELGRFPEAHTIAEEAATVLRELAEGDPATYLPKLAKVMSNLGTILSVRSAEEALPAAHEAIGLFRQLAEVNPGRYSADLAASVINLMAVLLGLGRYADALKAAEEALAHYRPLAKANPAAYEPKLALALANCCIALSALGRHDEALPPMREAVGIFRQLAQVSPAAHQADLARALGALGGLLAETGRREEAKASLEEARNIYLKSVRPYESLETSYTPLKRAYANWITRLADLCHETGNRETEASALIDLSNVLKGQERCDKAVSAARRAADICVETDDRAGEAAALISLATALDNLGKTDKAIIACERAVTIFREKGDTRLEAATLINLSALLASAGRPTEAITAAKRSCCLAEGNRGQPFYHLGRALLKTGRVDEAIEAFQQAATAYRSTGKGDHAQGARP